MQNIRGMVVVLAVGGVIYGAGVSALAEPKSGGAHKAFKPAQPLEAMMEGQAFLYKGIKDAMLDKNWKDAAKSAWILAEVANANQYQNDDGKYQGFASQMSHQCVELAKALKKKDEAAAKDLVSKVGATCGACHDAFKKD